MYRPISATKYASAKFYEEFNMFYLVSYLLIGLFISALFGGMARHASKEDEWMDK